MFKSEMEKVHNTDDWVKPEIEELGNAKDLVAQTNQYGGGDVVYSILLPS